MPDPDKIENLIKEATRAAWVGDWKKVAELEDQIERIIFTEAIEEERKREEDERKASS